MARWSYVTGYTLNGMELVARSTGDPKYWGFIKRVMDQFIDEKGNLKENIRLESLDNVMPGNIVVGLYEHTRDERYRTAAEQITIFARHCLKGDSGLYYHAWAEKPELRVVIGSHRPPQPTHWADPKTGLSSEAWTLAC